MPPTRPCTLDEIIVPPAAAPLSDRAAAREAFAALSRTMADEPRFAIERLTQAAMKLTRAQAAGVSLEDRASGRSVFRWITTTGALSRYANCTMPRHYSPCGAAVARQRALIMRDPARFYPYIRDLDVPIGTALLVPFTRERNRAGTLWTVAEPGTSAFTTEDVRIIQVLTTFTTAMLRTLDRSGQLRGEPGHP